MASGNNVEDAIRRLYKLRTKGRGSEYKEVKMLECNREDIVKYQRHMSANGIGKARQLKVVDTLRYWTAYIKKPWKEMTREDIEEAVGTLLSTTLKDSHKEGMKIILRQFYGWLEGKKGVLPDKVSWMKVDMKKYTLQADQEQCLCHSQ